jgi:hypothetical protein
MIDKAPHGAKRARLSPEKAKALREAAVGELLWKAVKVIFFAMQYIKVMRWLNVELDNLVSG